MGYKGELIEINGRKILSVRGIFDYFNKNNFERLEEAARQAEQEKAELYIGLYSDRLLMKTKHKRKLHNLVKDEDRVFALESLDFVNGAFIIDSTKKEKIEESLQAKLFRQENEQNAQRYKVNSKIDKKYSIGYASGAFSNLHKGHIEHLKEMHDACEKIIVAANSDRLINSYKNKKASVDEKTRQKILSHIKYVDIAIVTDEYDKLKAIENVRELCGKEFDAIFVGSDWKGDPKWDEFEKKFKAMNIDVVFTDRPKDGISTTKIEAARKEELEL